MTDTIPTPQQLLTTAANIIESHGWTQCQFLAEHGQVCMVGAMRLAAATHIGLTPSTSADEITAGSRMVWPEENRDELRAVFDKATDLAAARVGGQLLTKWNDAYGRTANHVVTVLRAAAEVTA